MSTVDSFFHDLGKIIPWTVALTADPVVTTVVIVPGITLEVSPGIFKGYSVILHTGTGRFIRFNENSKDKLFDFLKELVQGGKDRNAPFHKQLFELNLKVDHLTKENELLFLKLKKTKYQLKEALDFHPASSKVQNLKEEFEALADQ